MPIAGYTAAVKLETKDPKETINSTSSNHTSIDCNVLTTALLLSRRRNDDFHRVPARNSIFRMFTLEVLSEVLRAVHGELASWADTLD